MDPGDFYDKKQEYVQISLDRLRPLYVRWTVSVVESSGIGEAQLLAMRRSEAVRQLAQHLVDQDLVHWTDMPMDEVAFASVYQGVVNVVAPAKGRTL